MMMQCNIEIGLAVRVMGSKARQKRNKAAQQNSVGADKDRQKVSTISRRND
jgi:hypothetical protein